MIRRLFFLHLFFSFFLTSCKPRPADTDIIIISFNDVHGSFKYLPKIAAFVQETRARHDHVIVVDAGDFFTGNPYNDFHEKKEYPIIDLLNTVGLDISVVGNHEFDYGAELLSQRLQSAEFIEISTNIVTKGTVLEGKVKPSHTFVKGGYNVMFFGLTNVDSRTKKTTALLEHVQNITFLDPFETAKSQKLHRKNVDVFIALTHIGIDDDRMLADLMPELDLIIGGHSHTLIDTLETRNGVAILQVEKHGKFIDKTTISMRNGVVAGIANETIDVTTLTNECPIVVKKVREYMNNPFLFTPIATLKYGLSDERQIGYMIVDAALTLPSVDLSILNCGSIRTNRLKAGAISYVDVLQAYPFSNHYVILSMTPAEIRELIETEFGTFRRHCFMYPGGFRYVLQQQANPDEAKVIELTYPNGEKLDENKVYRMAMNNYLSSRFLSDHCPTKTQITPVFVLDNMVDFLKRNPNVDYRKAKKRVKI